MSRLLRRLFPRTSSQRRPAPVTRKAGPFRTSLRLNELEGRVVPATFTVSNSIDDPGASFGSLRAAILNANANPGADTIAIGSVKVISLGSALPVISDAVTITAPGSGLLTIQRDPSAPTSFRIFDIGGLGSQPFNVSLSGMTISGGRTVDVSKGDGGGVRISTQSVTLDDVAITGNSAASSGGGISMGPGTLAVRNSTISGNVAGTAGAGSFLQGGGLYMLGGTLSLVNSTVSGNTSPTDGGGLYLFNPSAAGSWTIDNSTIAGNQAGGSGGGVIMRSPTNGTGTHTLLIRNSTVANNLSKGDKPGGGGGIAKIGAAGTVSLASTIVANNAANFATDVLGTVTANFSLIRDPASADISGSNNQLDGADPRLGGLGSNGGPTQTMALLFGSAAVDKGSNSASLTTDQRGAGFARVQSNAADIGAYERPVLGPTASGTFSDVTTSGGTTYTFAVTYTDDTAINVGTLDNNDIRVTGPNGFNQLATLVSVNNSANGTPRVATYRINAPGGTFDATDNGAYTASVEPSQAFNTTGVDVPPGSLGAFQVLMSGTFIVTNANDSGSGSLRDAIAQANAFNTADMIVFSSLFSTPQTIALQSALPDITNPVVMTGPGASLLTVRRDTAASTNFRIFTINGPTALGVSLSGLTITGGRSTSTGGGVGLTGSPTVAISDSVVTGNSAAAGGGGIHMSTGNLAVANSTISGNTAGTNAAQSFRGGGGLYALGGNLSVENSTISGNQSPTDGAGLYLYNGGSGTWTLRNCTISGNQAGARGGGILMLSPSGGTGTHALTIQNSTLANNIATSTTPFFVTTGGGIAKVGAAGTVSLTSTIVANNFANIAADVSGPATATFSLIRDQNGATITGDNTNQPAGTDPRLGALANNGGPTQTMALLAGSPAINKGSNPVNVVTDQRGPGFARTIGTATDIGAFEVQQSIPPKVASVVPNNGAVQRSMVTSLAVTFDKVVTLPANAASAFTLFRISDGAAVTFTASAATVGGVTVVTLNGFTGAAANGFGSLADGRYALRALSAQITAGALFLDGNGDGAGGGTPSDDFVFADSGATTGNQLFRLFGDATGDRAVNQADLNLFRTVFGGQTSDITFDVNHDGVINQTDLNAFRTNFGAII